MSRQKSLSEKVLGFNWEDHLPHRIDEHEQIELSSFDQAMEFHRENYARVFTLEGQEMPFLEDPFTEFKQKYYREVGDFMVFRRDSKVIGVYTGTLIDWSTYYHRNLYFLSEFQSQGRGTKIQDFVHQILRNFGVVKTEADISPSNLAQVKMLNRAEYNIAGVNYSERWGVLVRFCKFLNPRNEKAFLDRFCYGVKPQLRSSENPPFEKGG
ncbi:MAG TPA: GNAT family N-acetyltransferase [bacterium]|nr:GNAT family N-acetyltransferase [bacterium]